MEEPQDHDTPSSSHLDFSAHHNPTICDKYYSCTTTAADVVSTESFHETTHHLIAETRKRPPALYIAGDITPRFAVLLARPHKVEYTSYVQTLALLMSPQILDMLMLVMVSLHEIQRHRRLDLRAARETRALSLPVASRPYVWERKQQR